MDLITTPAVTGQSPPENSIVHTTSVSLTSRAPNDPVHLVQYDTTLSIVAVALTANGQPYAVPSGAAVNVRLAKQDGTYVYNPAYGISSDGYTVYIAITVQMTVFSGKVSPIVEVVLNGAVAGTGFFVLDIDPNPIPEDAIASTNEYKTIQQIAAEVQQAAKIVSDNKTAINAVADNLSALTTVAGIAGNITTVADIAGNVTTVAENVAQMQQVVDNLPDIKNAEENAASAAESSTLSESWAVGGTGTRTGEDTNNSKFWSEQAAQAANGYLGYFATPDALQSAHPTGNAGNWATVGSTQSVWFWNGTAFVNTLIQASNAVSGTVKVSDSPDASLSASGGWAVSPKAVAPLLDIGSTVSGTANSFNIQNGGATGTLATLQIPSAGVWLVFCTGWVPDRQAGIMLLKASQTISSSSTGSFTFSLSGILKTSAPVPVLLQMTNWGTDAVSGSEISDLHFTAVLISNVAANYQNLESEV